MFFGFLFIVLDYRVVISELYYNAISVQCNTHNHHTPSMLSEEKVVITKVHYPRGEQGEVCRERWYMDSERYQKSVGMRGIHESSSNVL